METWQVRSYGSLANINWWWWLQKSKQKFEETKERAHGTSTWGKPGASQGRDAAWIDLGYGCHQRTSEEQSYLSTSSLCSWNIHSVLGGKKKVHLRMNALSHKSQRRWTGSDAQMVYPHELCLDPTLWVFFSFLPNDIYMSQLSNWSKRENKILRELEET